MVKPTNKIHLTWTVKRAQINKDDIDPERRASLLEIFKDADEATVQQKALTALGLLKFEYDTENLDEGHPFKASSLLLDVDPTDPKYQIQIGTDGDDELIMSGSVSFDLELDPNSEIKSPDKIQEWLDDGWGANNGDLSGGWAFDSDDGTTLTVHH